MAMHRLSIILVWTCYSQIERDRTFSHLLWVPILFRPLESPLPTLPWNFPIVFDANMAAGDSFRLHKDTLQPTES